MRDVGDARAAGCTSSVESYIYYTRANVARVSRTCRFACVMWHDHVCMYVSHPVTRV